MRENNLDETKIITICPRCGCIDTIERNRSMPCIYCQYPKPIKTDIELNFYIDEVASKEKEKIEWEQDLREKYVFSLDNTEYDPFAYNYREEQDDSEGRKSLKLPTPQLMFKICLKCGEFQVGDGEKDEPCRRCGGKLKTTNYTGDEGYAWSIEQVHRIEKILRERYVLSPNNNEYDEDEYYAREDDDIRFEMQLQKNLDSLKKPSNSYACPKCGGTSFTPVRRKWSVLTGFMTNKVDMVCNKCGYVKKG